MKDGFKGSLIGFVGGILIGILVIMIAKWYALNYFNKRLDSYFLMLLGGLGSLIGYVSTMTFKLVSKALNDMKEALKLKADKAYVDDHLNEQRENNKIHIDALQEQLTSMDHKLDILIELKKR